jgi:uncharacterized membrane protein HdeD (DUF308 family)
MNGNGMEIDVDALARNWWAIGLRGVAAIVFGVLTFVLPGLSLAVLILLYGSFVLVEGVFNVVAAIRGRTGDHPRWLLLAEGLVSTAAGLITFLMPRLTAVVLLYVIAGWAILTGILEMAAAVRLRNRLEGEWRLALSGVLSVVFGVLLAVFPGAGALALVLWIGAYAVVFGALLVALAIRLRGAMTETRRAVRRAA